MSLRSRRMSMLARCKVRVPKKPGRARGMNAFGAGVMGGGGVTSRRKVRPGNISRRGRTKGDTMPRAGSILLAREKRIADGRIRLRGYVARETPRVDRATLLPKRCSPLGLGKQRATGLPRGVINHFLLRKAKRDGQREREREKEERGWRWEEERKEIPARWEALEDQHRKSMAWHWDSRVESIDLKSLINWGKNIASVKSHRNVLE